MNNGNSHKKLTYDFLIHFKNLLEINGRLSAYFTALQEWEKSLSENF